jgi:membrane-bound ClpP family serine protease
MYNKFILGGVILPILQVFSFVNNISWLSGLCLIIGLGLVILEMFHPGFGAPGLTGLTLIITSIILTAKSPFDAAVMICIIIIILGVALYFVMKSATKGKLSKILVLKDSFKKESGYSGTKNVDYLTGMQGITITPLRPAGTVEIDGQRINVVTDGEFIPKDSSIFVSKVEGMRVVVKATANQFEQIK